jgi:type IV pilus assembly protein PilW
MSTQRKTLTAPLHRARGFTIVELMVTISIALFLLGGLVTILQTVRRTYASQQAQVQLQDQQRFAVTLLTDVIQSGGYYDNPTGDTVFSALTAVAPNFGSGQAFFGTQGAAVPAAGDIIYIRFRTAPGDGIINCAGTSNTTAAEQVYTNEFYVNAATGQLMCILSTAGVAAAPVPLVNGVANLQIYYGVKRAVPAVDYNVDTYEQANAMQASDWDQISSVRIRVTFANPLWGTPNQPVTIQHYITFERVIQVMSRAGDYT